MAFKSYKIYKFKFINPKLMKTISNYSSHHHLCIHVIFILLLHDFVLLFIVLLFLLVCDDVYEQKSTLLLISKSSTFKGNPLKGSQSKLLSLLSNLFFKNKASVLDHIDPILRTQYSLLACLCQLNTYARVYQYLLFHAL